MHSREIGLKNANGIISLGIFNDVITGDIILTKKSITPELLKAPIATKSPINVGKRFKTISIPSFAPSKKLSKILIFSFNPIIIIIIIIIGIIAFEK